VAASKPDKNAPRFMRRFRSLRSWNARPPLVALPFDFPLPRRLRKGSTGRNANLAALMNRCSMAKRRARIASASAASLAGI
jgi:hypothetical protein